jgi:hypothetical protein
MLPELAFSRAEILAFFSASSNSQARARLTCTQQARPRLQLIILIKQNNILGLQISKVGHVNSTLIALNLI